MDFSNTELLKQIYIIRFTNKRPLSIVDTYVQLLTRSRLRNDPAYLPEHISLEYMVGRILYDEKKVKCYKYAYMCPLSDITKNLYSINTTAHILMQNVLGENSYMFIPNDEVKNFSSNILSKFKGNLVGYNFDKNYKCEVALEYESPDIKISNETSNQSTNQSINQPNDNQNNLYHTINNILKQKQGELTFILEEGHIHVQLGKKRNPLIRLFQRSKKGAIIYEDNHTLIDSYEDYAKDVSKCINFQGKEDLKQSCSKFNTYVPTALGLDPNSLTIEEKIPTFAESFLFRAISLSADIKSIITTHPIEPLLHDFLNDISDSIKYAGIIAEFFGRFDKYDYNYMYNNKDINRKLSIRRTLINIRKDNPRIRDLEAELYLLVSRFNNGDRSSDLVSNFNNAYSNYERELRDINEKLVTRESLIAFDSIKNNSE
jgi:hypothetical protein